MSPKKETIRDLRHVVYVLSRVCEDWDKLIGESDQLIKHYPEHLPSLPSLVDSLDNWVTTLED